MNESETVPGDLYETPNGNRYLVLPNNQLAYLGNKYFARSQGLIDKSGAECRVLSRIRLPPYKDAESLQDDWDDVQGIERFPPPLPQGCTCDPHQLSAIIECPIHRVTALAPDVTDKGMSWVQEKVREKAHELLSHHFNEKLELEVDLTLQGHTPSQRNLASQNHACTITLLTGQAKMVSSTGGR